MGLLEKLHALGVTIVVITHDRDIAARMGRRIEMLDGQIIHDNTEAARRAPTPAPDETAHDTDPRP